MASSLSRDAVQGFIDGYKAAGGDVSQVQAQISQQKSLTVASADPLTQSLSDWMANHPTYKQDKASIDSILADLGSYSI